MVTEATDPVGDIAPERSIRDCIEGCILAVAEIADIADGLRGGRIVGSLGSAAEAGRGIPAIKVEVVVDLEVIFGASRLPSQSRPKMPKTDNFLQVDTSCYLECRPFISSIVLTKLIVDQFVDFVDQFVDSHTSQDQLRIAPSIDPLSGWLSNCLSMITITITIIPRWLSTLFPSFSRRQTQPNRLWKKQLPHMKRGK